MCKTSTGVKRPISSPLVNLFLLDNASPYVRPEASQQPAYQTPTSPAVSQVSTAPSAALSLDAPAFSSVYNMTPSSMPTAMPLMMSSSSSSSSSSSYSEATPSVNHQLNLSEEKQAPSGIPACINCRRSKVRCEGGIPCRRCLRLGMDVSCARCEPQKRGRKRKQPSDGTIKLEGEAKAPVVKRPRVRAPAATNKPSAAAAHAAAASFNSGAAVVPTVATPADQVEQEAVERFSLLTRQFRSWRDQAFTKPEDKAGLTRFLMFCSDISHLMHEYSQQLQHVADKNKLVSFWLCSNLADDVNRVVTTLGPVAVLPKMNSDASMETGVEKQVYKRMPFGVMMLPLQPRPFAGDSKPWTNSLVTELLGYSKDECQTILSQRTEFNRLLQNSTTMMCAFWEAVMAQKPSYTCRSLWTHKSGATVATVTTCWIKYARGLPAWQCLYLQQDPAYAPVLPTRVPLAAAAPVAAPVVAAPAPAPVVMVKSAPSSADDSLLLAKHASSSLMARPSFSSVFDDVMVLSPSGTPSDDATSSWDESTDKWLGNTSFDDIELML